MARTKLSQSYLPLFILSSLVPDAQSIPTTKQLSLGGGLTILSYNDLNNTPTPGSGAILINQASPFSSALASCKLLGETLWSSAGETFSLGLNSTLSYQVYLGQFPHNQLFWISSTTNAKCSAINYQGTISQVECEKELPALCSQSAPVSNFTFTDNNTPAFQITQQVGAQSITGYRDFYAWKFFGVRYAAKPARFTYSTPIDGTGNITAVSYPKDCQQYPGQVPAGGSAEDCLFLNIWTPYLSTPSPVAKVQLKPVMLWIYGGGFTSGSASDPNTDGTNLASRGDVVVVALNYRLGYFGFMAYPDGVHNGNYGIGDMVTALQWISKNIEAFGGDPDRVTIFGESAGAAAVRALLASPKAKGLYSNAIMQSTPDGWPAAAPIAHYMIIAEYAATFTGSALTSTNCSNATEPIACLSAVDPVYLATLQQAAQFPVIDGTYLTTHELALNNSSGHTSDIAVMTGGIRDEAAILLPLAQPGLTLAEWFSALSSLGFIQYPILTNGTTLFDIPANPTTDQIANITFRVGTDGLFNCALEAEAYSAAKHNVFASTYSFMFNRTYSPTNYTEDWCQPANTTTHPYGDPSLEYFKCHGGEQLYVFGNVRLGLPDRDGLDVPFSQLVVDYWSSFAWNRDPNPKREVLEARGYWGTLAELERVGMWEKVKEGKNEWMWLQWDGKMKAFAELEQCAFVGLPLEYMETS